jgi:hypothetical protein
MDPSVSAKDEIWFLRVCHHVSNAVYKLMEKAISFAAVGCRYGVHEKRIRCFMINEDKIMGSAKVCGTASAKISVVKLP